MCAARLPNVWLTIGYLQEAPHPQSPHDKFVHDMVHNLAIVSKVLKAPRVKDLPSYLPWEPKTLNSTGWHVLA